MRRLWLAMSVLAFGTVGAAAEEPARQESLEFSVTPYIWLAGVDGDATIGDRSRAGSADFGDILTDLKFAFMGSAELRYGRFGLVGDFLNFEFKQGVTTPHNMLFAGGTGSMNATGLALVALFRAVDDPRFSLDLGAGIRPWWVDTKLHLNAGLAAARTFSASDNWTDPILALRAHGRLSEQFGLTAYADIGGFNVGSKLTWQFLATVDWQPKDWLVFHAGWRYLAFDFENGERKLDMHMGGPILGATFRF